MKIMQRNVQKAHDSKVSIDHDSKIQQGQVEVPAE
jgi:hypothetical protein